MIIGIDMGHTLSGADYGAVGYVKESEETRIIGNELVSIFNKFGHKVINCTVDYASSVADSINKRVNKANAQHLDLFISIHLNASINPEGRGTEILRYDGKDVQGNKASNILNNFSKLGFANRGIKKRTDLGVLNNTKAEALLIECFFVTNKQDVEIYKKDTSNIAKAIVYGVLNKNFEEVQTLTEADVKRIATEAVNQIINNPSQEVSEWAKGHINRFVANKVISGDINPKQIPTREQLFTVLGRAMYNEDPKPSQWAEEYVKKATDLGIVKGDDVGNIKPKSLITREEVIALIIRSLGLEKG